MDKVGVFFAEGFEEIEALTVVDLLRRSQIDTVMVSVTGAKQVTGSHRITVEMDALLEEIDFAQMTMIVLPGGMPGTKNLDACDALMEQVEKFYKDGKDLCAICAAPSILGRRGMLSGKRACSFPEFESFLEGAQVTHNASETAGNIITARGMGCAIEFGLAIVEKLKGVAAAEQLAGKIVYKRRPDHA